MKKLFTILFCILALLALIFTILKIKQNTANTKISKLTVIAYTLIPNNKGEAAFKNVTELQKYVDMVSKNGGGIVHIPEGTFYFKVNPYDRKKNWVKTGNDCHYAIWCKDNVLIEGEGIDKTILKPYGTYPHGLNMFNYTVTFDENDTGNSPIYLDNADFRNFTINSDEEQYQNPQSSDYRAMGKGFMMVPIKNCDWENIKVMNTDGTGFGVDLPINCTITNCIAIGCGKAATENDVGASGFGIGTGLTNEESMVISNCTSISNKKYGYFFENQTRFGRFNKQPSQASTSDGYVVINCKASGNLYDFGGARANDVVYENCISSGTPRASSVFYEKHSFNTYHTGIKIDSNSSSSKSISWANSIGLIQDIENNSKLTIADSILYLYKYSGMPGKIVKWSNGNVANKLKSQYFDIKESNTYFDALEWAVNSKIITPNENPNNICTKGAFINILSNYSDNDISSKDLGIEKNIIDKDNLNSDTPLAKTDLINYLYKYNSSKGTKFNIKYYLLGGKINQPNKTYYISGKDSFTLNNPTKEGYVFVGWTGSISDEYSENNYIPIKNINISINDSGNKVFTANWIPIKNE